MLEYFNDFSNLDIKPLCSDSMEKSKNRWDNIAKPLNSLGKLEDTIIKISGIQRTENIDISKPIVIVMCADNGVVAQNITQSTKEVTYIVADNITKSNASVCVMAKSIKAEVVAVDIGIDKDYDNINIINKKIMYGTNDISLTNAMDKQSCIKAINVGIDLVKEYKSNGKNIIITGEMGIGNTTTSSCLASVYLNKAVEEVTGKGAGLSTEGIKRKINIIKKAININKVNTNDPIDVLHKLGGLDIAGMVGLFLGGAIYNIPIVVDGFISAIAALISVKINEKAIDYLIPSHVSFEPCGKFVLEELNLSPLINCNMCLGEGTGGVLGVSLLQTASNVYYSMKSFEEANIEKYVPLK